MLITNKDWNKYTANQEAIRTKAANEMQAYIEKFGTDDRKSLIQFAKALTNKYGESAGAYACQLFDEIAAASKVVTSATMASVASFEEVAKAVNGSLLQSPSGQLVPQVVERLTKQVAEDTMLKNAKEYSAEWAWIPDGGACPFCIALASEGWHHMGKNSDVHADHIHANCNCEFTVRFSPKDNVFGYKPEKLKAEYEDADGRSARDKINSMRRIDYKAQREKINEQKREAYAIRTENESQEGTK